MKPFLYLSLLLASVVASQAGDEDFPGDYRLLLPPTIPALTDLETNIYFDNTYLALNPDNFFVDVIARRGRHQEHRWTYRPTTEPEKRDIGHHVVTLELRNQKNEIIGRASTKVQVCSREVSADAKPQSLLIMGDSLTNASVYSGRIAELAKEDQLPLRLIGTRGPGAEAQPGGGDGSGNRHEGYGGWTALRFATKYTGIARGGEYKQCGSPFLYQDGNADPKLDFARYCKEFNEGNAPDFVTILLGCNDTFHGTDETVEERIDVMFEHFETLLTMIQDHDPATKVGAILPVPPAASQDAFGENYASGQTRWHYRRNQHRLLERMIETFGNRDKSNVYLVPAWLNLDPIDGFPSRESKAHAHSETIARRQINGVHPSREGYRQMGDAIYAWIRSFE